MQHDDDVEKREDRTWGKVQLGSIRYAAVHRVDRRKGDAVAMVTHKLRQELTTRERKQQRVS